MKCGSSSVSTEQDDAFIKAEEDADAALHQADDAAAENAAPSRDEFNQMKA